MHDKPRPEERPCRLTLSAFHATHRYMLGGVIYQCPGGEVATRDSEARSCPMAGDVPHDAHGWTYLVDGSAYRCPGWSELDAAAKEPAPPQTDAQRVRDLEYVIQRARETLGADTPAAPCEGHVARITALEGALRDVLGQFVHPGHPGEPCKQTGWVRVATIDRWHTVLRGEA